MSYTITHKPELNTLIATFTQPFAVARDATAITKVLQQWLADTDGEVFYIADMRQVTISLQELTQGLTIAFRDPQSPYANPRLKTYTIGSDILIRMGGKAAAQRDQYGQVNMEIYASLEEALEKIQVRRASAR